MWSSKEIAALSKALEMRLPEIPTQEGKDWVEALRDKVQTLSSNYFTFRTTSQMQKEVVVILGKLKLLREEYTNPTLPPVVLERIKRDMSSYLARLGVISTYLNSDAIGYEEYVKRVLRVKVAGKIMTEEKKSFSQATVLAEADPRYLEEKKKMTGFKLNADIVKKETAFYLKMWGMVEQSLFTANNQAKSERYGG